MIGYFDTSAFVPLAVDEASSDFCERMWNECDDVMSSRLIHVEAAAALSQALRQGRVTESDHMIALSTLEHMQVELKMIEVTEGVVARAAQIAHACALRGYDAVHAASAELLEERDLVVFSGDAKLLKACQSLGLAVADINNPE